MIRRDGNIVIVSCDVCDVTFRQWGATSAAIATAEGRSWLCGTRYLTARCPQCSACPDCGGVHESLNAAHIRGGHHTALTLCTRRAITGFAPVHPALIGSLRADAVEVSDAVHYGTDANGRLAEYAINFARVECVEELSQPIAATTVAAAKLCRDHGVAWWDAWSQACGKGPRGLARRVPAHRRGDPWPGLEHVASRDELDAQMVLT